MLAEAKINNKPANFAHILPDGGIEPSGSIISVNNLAKSFQVYLKRDGVKGSIKDLFSRRYETKQAVSGISFEIQKGEFLGLIGPNGAGKSTTIKMLTGILKPSAGQLNILEMDPFKERKRYCQRIGAVFGQRTQLWWDIATKESFKLLGKIYKVSESEFEGRMKQLIEVLEIGDILDTPVRKLSLGQRMRCDIAASLIHNPEILFLDEPTIGLDAVAKESIRKFLKFINKEYKTTILLTTHDLRDLEELCERLIVIDSGKVVFDGKLNNLRNRISPNKTLLIESSSIVDHEKLSKFELDIGIKPTVVSPTGFSIEFDPQSVSTDDLLRKTLEIGTISEISFKVPDIESVIIELYRSGVK